MMVITVFARCPCCNYDQYSVEVRMDHEIHIGVASCWVCLKKVRAHLRAGSKPINVYIAWIDRERERMKERNRPRARVPSEGSEA